tara:strand:+ start:96 stop:347 length:252 start_codon:yes stop_codon:yes gene_type:complete
MRNLLILAAMFCTMNSTLEASEPARCEMVYIHPVPVFYTWIGGYTKFPQYPTHRPSYYVWPKIVVKKEKPEDYTLLGDLPQYH